MWKGAKLHILGIVPTSEVLVRSLSHLEAPGLEFNVTTVIVWLPKTPSDPGQGSG